MKMIKVLGSHQEAPLSVSEVAEKLQISQPTATKHLAILREAGWITREQVAREVHYRLNLDTVAEFRMLIDLAFETARPARLWPLASSMAMSCSVVGSRPTTEQLWVSNLRPRPR